MSGVSVARITTESPDLSPVLGQLSDEQHANVLAQLEAADRRLSEAAAALAERGPLTWRWAGVVLELADSGQTSIDAVLQEMTAKLSFTAQLRPWNFFPTEAGMWQPGKRPLQMATDAWDVDGAISVRFKTRVAGRPFTIQQHALEFPEERYGDAVSAAVGFASRCVELAELALSREPSVEAWKPAESEPDAGRSRSGV